MLLKTSAVLQFENYVIDRPRWLLHWQNEPIALNPKTFDLLLYLVDHRERVVGKEELLQALWPDQFVEESNLTQHVFLLRKALSRHASGSRIIETVAGRGYRFSATVHEPREAEAPEEQLVVAASQSITRFTLEEELAEPDALPVSASHRLHMPVQFQNRWLRLAGWLLLATALLIAGRFGRQKWLDQTTGSPVDAILLPLEGTTGDPILDRALVDALRMDLAQSPFVSVVSSARVRATLTQMQKNPDDPVTTAIARDVCERIGSQALLRGTVSRIGKKFFLTEEATSCVNGGTLAEAKREAGSAEELPHSLDRVAASLRQKLGESRRSIARFDAPLLPMNTASLEALKAYSQGSHDSELGKTADAIALAKTAIVADPNFAAAYYDLAALYASAEDFPGEQDAIQKAYRVRDSATEPVRLAITALYISVVTQDLYAAERNYQTWTEIYPRSAAAWNGLGVVQRDLGKQADALAADQHALSLRPMNQGMYVNVADQQLRVGDPMGTRATCDQAIGKGLDGDRVRGNLMEAAFSIQDAALLRQQRDWVAAHPEAVFCRVLETEIAIVEGRFKDTVRLVTEASDSFRHQGMASVADEIQRTEGVNLMEAGDLDDGRRLFHGSAIDPESSADLDGLLRSGEISAAQAELHAMQQKYPQGTIWKLYLAPFVQAIAAMDAHKPKDAIAALEISRPLEGRDFGHQFLRAEAYLVAGEAGDAEKQYRGILAGADKNSTAIEVPLSWLGLGRALSAGGDRTGAIEAYRHFLQAWAHADADALYLKQAKHELADLQRTSSHL